MASEQTELMMDRLERFAREQPDRSAVIDISRKPEARLSYGELMSLAERVAGG